MDTEDMREIIQQMRPKMVCICCHVSREKIEEVIYEGACSFEEIQQKTECSMGCGTCREQVEQIMKETLKKK